MLYFFHFRLKFNRIFLFHNFGDLRNAIKKTLGYFRLLKENVYQKVYHHYAKIFPLQFVSFLKYESEKKSDAKNNIFSKTSNT